MELLPLGSLGNLLCESEMPWTLKTAQEELAKHAGPTSFRTVPILDEIADRTLWSLQSIGRCQPCNRAELDGLRAIAEQVCTLNCFCVVLAVLISVTREACK